MAVTSTNNLRKGMKDTNGSTDIAQLQTLLNKAGNYNLDVDGSFGSKTLAAVQDYQQRNGLNVDGVVGTNTWGALTKAQNPSAGTSAPVQTTGFQYEAYQPSDAVKQAEALLQQHLAQKPGAYQSPRQTQLNDTLQKILNREKFSYDLNGDMLYQQYKDQAVTQGKMAMMDTMGQAQAMTGGYGNSYAQSVGQQAYQGQLQKLNEVIPELYQLALDKYNAEGQAMYDQAALMAQMENQDYGRYRDQVSDYNAELDRLAEDARYKAETDYGKWADNRDFTYGQHVDDRNYAYQQERDKVADEQWQRTFDEGIRQFNLQQASSGKGGSGGSSGTGGSGGKGGNSGNEDTGVTGNLSSNQIKMIQFALGVPATGVWDEQTISTSGYYDMDQAWEAYNRKGTLGSSRNAELLEGNKLNAQIKGKDDATKEQMIKSAYENGTISAAIAEELLRVNNLL